MKFAVENESCPNTPSYCETPAPNDSWLRFCSSSFSVTSTLLSVPGVFSVVMFFWSSSGLKYPSWFSRLTLYLSASVL